MSTWSELSERRNCLVKSQVTQYIRTELLFEFDEGTDESTDLFRAGVIDSYGYIQMMQFIQKEFGVKFSKDELLSNMVTSLSGIVATVERKLDLIGGGQSE